MCNQHMRLQYVEMKKCFIDLVFFKPHFTSIFFRDTNEFEKWKLCKHRKMRNEFLGTASKTFQYIEFNFIKQGDFHSFDKGKRYTKTKR